MKGFFKKIWVPIVAYICFVIVLWVTAPEHLKTQLYVYNFQYDAPSGLGAPPQIEQIEQGDNLYHQYCSGCHGDNGEGQDASIPYGGNRVLEGKKVLLAPAMNNEGHAWGHHDNALFFNTKYGSTWVESSTMRPWGDILTDEEIISVVFYIKSLWSGNSKMLQAQLFDHPIP